MDIYKLDPASFKNVRKKLIIRSLPITIIATGAGVAMSMANRSSGVGDSSFLLFLLPVLAVSIGFGLYRGIKRQKVLYDSYTLTLLPNLISREQANTLTIAIYINDIESIFRDKNDCILVKGKGPQDLIMIPVELENHDDLVRKLEAIQQVTDKNPQSPMVRYSIPLALVNLAGMAGVLLLTNKLLVALSGVVVVALTTWSVVNTRRNKNVDRKTKRSILWALLVVVWIIVIVFYKLTGTTSSPFF